MSQERINTAEDEALQQPSSADAVFSDSHTFRGAAPGPASSQPTCSQQVLQELNELEHYVRLWHRNTREELARSRQGFAQAIREMEELLSSSSSSSVSGGVTAAKSLFMGPTQPLGFGLVSTKTNTPPPTPGHNPTGRPGSLNKDAPLFRPTSATSTPGAASTTAAAATSTLLAAAAAAPNNNNNNNNNSNNNNNNIFGDAAVGKVSDKPKGLDWEVLLGSSTGQTQLPKPEESNKKNNNNTNNISSNNNNNNSSTTNYLSVTNQGSATVSPTKRIPPSPSVHSHSAVSAQSTPVREATTTNNNTTSTTTGASVCNVLVEFKRKRVLRFDSRTYVCVGEYVVVAADRGEDIGLVTHVWGCGAPDPGGKWCSSPVFGEVIRPATLLEVSQLQGVQSELEGRAVEVAQEKVLEHDLPMRIVDAEYQFDRKKLTFYYQSDYRLDFRNLLRDLYKIFRARIWLEQESAS